MREIGRLTIIPKSARDYPVVDLLARFHVALTATATRRALARGTRTAAVPDEQLGRRTFTIDVQMEAAVDAGRERPPHHPASGDVTSVVGRYVAGAPSEQGRPWCRETIRS